MLKQKNGALKAKIQQNINKGTIVIDSGSLVYDNKWISYQGTVFNFETYVDSVVDGASRRKFFKKKNYAVQIVVGIDKSGALKVKEGNQILFVSKKAVPIPLELDMIPLVSVLYIQDGSDDLTLGYKPIKSSNITYFSGFGNVLGKDQKGTSNNVKGSTGNEGVRGVTGNKGALGNQGLTGFQGITGTQGASVFGETGPIGITGINWDINVSFTSFF